MSRKGPQWERELAKAFSLWWTQDEVEPRDDVFWRTSQSGGRATTRAKSGKKTKNHYGDLLATDPIGQPLLDLVTIECKNGYSKFSFADVVDSHNGKTPLYEEWIDKLASTTQEAGTQFWMLVVKRNRKKPLIFIPSDLLGDILLVKSSFYPIPIATIEFGKEHKVEVFPLECFFAGVTPQNIKRILKSYR